MYRKTIPALVLSGCLAMTACLAIPAFPAQASQEIYHISEDDSPVEYYSPEEIRDFFHSRPFSRTQPDTFDEEPDLESETAGKLSGESVENALNTLNFIRYIAGISADVETSDYYENMAMAGAALMTKTGMEHKPKKPAGVSQEFYQLAYEGTSSSNLGQGYRNLSTAITDGWIDDGIPPILTGSATEDGAWIRVCRPPASAMRAPIRPCTALTARTTDTRMCRKWCCGRP